MWAEELLTATTAGSSTYPVFRNRYYPTAIKTTPKRINHPKTEKEESLNSLARRERKKPRISPVHRLQNWRKSSSDFLRQIRKGQGTKKRRFCTEKKNTK